jgi:hypothetical protein
MLAALYSSSDEGSKEFVNNGITFGWETVETVYRADILRARCGISSCVPGLKYENIVRRAWTRLNVLPLRIMQV